MCIGFCFLYLLCLKKATTEPKSPIQNNFFNAKQFFYSTKFTAGWTCFSCIWSEQELRSCHCKSAVPYRFVPLYFPIPMHLFWSRHILLWEACLGTTALGAPIGFAIWSWDLIAGLALPRPKIPPSAHPYSSRNPTASWWLAHHL
jgi:hypothetical protein